MKKTVTVITSSIGRPELKQAIESVSNQTYPCRHLVFFNGKKWHERSRDVLLKTNYNRELTSFFFLNEETGDCGIGPGCGAVFAGAPYLTESDYITYLNDDDFYDKDHVESLVNFMEVQKLDWGFSLRKYLDKAGNFICNDDIESFGFWPTIYDQKEYLVDNSSFILKNSLARKMGGHWLDVSYYSDREFLKQLKSIKTRAGCSGLYTCNYRTSFGETSEDGYLNGAGIRHKSFFEVNQKRAKQQYPNGFPWAEETVRIFG